MSYPTKATRKFPEFYESKAGELVSAGIFVLVFGLCTLLASILADKKGLAEWIICLVTSSFGLVMVPGGIVISLAGFLARKKRNSWLGAAVTAQTTVVERNEAGYEDQFGVPIGYWRLELEMLPVQSAVNPGESTVGVKVSESVYKKCIHKDIVCIYYSPADPMTFLLEEELQ